MAFDLASLEKSLWDAADELRANSGLKASEYGTPVLGLIFLRFADSKFEAARESIEGKASTRRRAGPSEYQAARAVYLADDARYGHLLNLPEGSDLGREVNDAMAAVERDNPDLRGVLPRSYTAIGGTTIASLLRHINSYTKDLEGDAFGLVYEYFLGEVRDDRGPEGRRVLHAGLDRAPDRGDHRALPRAHLRSGLRLGRHVRAVGATSSNATGSSQARSCRSMARRRPARPSAWRR